jgi:hypothetical protein
VRPAILVFGLLICVHAAAHAQPHRFAVTPFVGGSVSSPVFEHGYSVQDHAAGIGASGHERLRVEETQVLGLRLEYRPLRRLALSVEAERGSGRQEHRRHALVQGSGGTMAESTSVRDATATLTSLAAAVGSRLPLGARLPTLGVRAGLAWHHLALEHAEAHCLPRSQGFSCSEADPWEPAYSAPAALAGLSAQLPFTRRAAVQVHADWSAGVLRTPGFREAWQPPAPGVVPPPAETRYWTLRYNAGLSFGP